MIKDRITRIFSALEGHYRAKSLRRKKNKMPARRFSPFEA
jgi:hypothetical protein